MAVWLKSSASATRPRRSVPGQAKEVVCPDTVRPRLEELRPVRRGYHVDTHIVSLVVSHEGLAASLDPGDHACPRRIAGLAVLTAYPPQVRDVLVLVPTFETDGGDVDWQSRLLLVTCCPA